MANKQSSARVSAVAARVLQPGYPSSRDDVIKDAKLLAGSVLSQDEDKGPKKKRAKKKAAR